MNEGTVFLVDDEPGMLKALARLLSAEGFAVKTFSNAEEFLATGPTDLSSCLVLDVAMPGLDGLELQRQLISIGSPIPVIFLTGHGDIPMSVRAMKSGAVDFLIKPVRDEDLLAAIRTALQIARERARENAHTNGLRARLARLTPREREVLSHVITGRLNKQIAAELGTCEQTIKIHRMRVMEKMAVKSVAELVRIADSLGVKPWKN